MFNLEENLKSLPIKPGVYIMKDKDENIIYVGKAVILKNRVKQYFRKTTKTIRIQKMVELICSFEYIVTDTEAEALILECNLIKEHRPKFNVLLKDDKTYPYIKINIKEDYPSVFITRKIVNDNAKYFGPYADAGAARVTMEFIKKNFKIRQCKSFKSTKKACLNFHIDRCLAPCIKNISIEDYKIIINDIIMFLEGKTGSIIKKLEQEIKNASEIKNYEHAAYLRDKKLAIESISEKQKVSNISENDIDVIGIARNEKIVCVEMFFVRRSKMIGREHYFLNDFENVEEKEILSGFIKQYYINKVQFPNKIMIKENIEDREIIEKILTEKQGRKVEIKSPQKGEKLRFVELAEKNAKITLDNKEKNEKNYEEEILKEIQKTLNLKNLPKKIESYDISNTSGTNSVAGMIVITNGKFDKKMYKRFKIKTVIGQDDPRSMAEVVERRIKHSLEDENGNFGKLPDLILLDGGITQINAILKVFSDYNIHVPMYGMVKDNKHRTRALLDINRVEIEISDEFMIFITKIQNEVHRFAIDYHRKLRGKLE